MVRFEITGSVDPLLRAELEPEDLILAESNAMVAMDAALTLEGRARDGVMQSLARKCLNDETFFLQKIRAGSRGGSVLLAPNIPGDIRILDVGEAQYMLSDGSYLASTAAVSVKTKTQSIGRALLGGSGGLFIMETEGRGRVAVSGFGSMAEVEVRPGRPVIVDNGHVVAWDASLAYELSLGTGASGFLGKVVNSQTTGEGVVIRFTGQGRVLVCSRNRRSFLDWVYAAFPAEKFVNNK